MSWDIYGNPLRRGHCEVHPHVHEEYPCSVCIAERNRSQQQPDYELERLNYELDQQNEYIKELKSERDALVAQVEVLQKEKSDLLVYVADSEKWFNKHDPNSYVSPKRVAAQQYLRDVQAEAGRDGYYEGFRAGIVTGTPLLPPQSNVSAIDHFKLTANSIARVKAEEYADKVRQGGE